MSYLAFVPEYCATHTHTHKLYISLNLCQSKAINKSYIACISVNAYSYNLNILIDIQLRYSTYMDIDSKIKTFSRKNKAFVLE